MKPFLIDLQKFNEFSKERQEFSYNTFGTPDKRGFLPALIHLREEVDELIANPEDESEWADCILLLLDAAERKGFTMDDLVRMASEKLAVNRKRTWARQENGVFKHV